MPITQCVNIFAPVDLNCINIASYSSFFVRHCSTQQPFFFTLNNTEMKLMLSFNSKIKISTLLHFQYECLIRFMERHYCICLVHCCTMSLCYLGAKTQISIQRSSSWATNYSWLDSVCLSSHPKSSLKELLRFPSGLYL